jgi:hypothetical protein
MTTSEKAYIAGIIDGEGSIMLLKFHRNQMPAPCISVASISHELLLWLKEKIGHGTIKTKKNYSPKKHKNSFSYIIKYDNAIRLLEEISPYLVIESKKIRAEIIINEYKSLTPRNGRYSKEQLIKKKDFYNRFIAL